MSSKYGKGFLQVSNMVCSLETLHQHVIYIYFHILSDLYFEDLIDEPLVGGSGVFQTEGHYFVAVYALIGYEGCMLLIFWCHLDLIIPNEGIYETQKSMVWSRIN